METVTLNVTKGNPTIQFALSCPQLISGEQETNPFLAVEEFFRFSAPSGHRKRLASWFKFAVSGGINYENASNLFFVYNQFLRLINAGFLIASRNVPYQPSHSSGESFGDWLIAVSTSIDNEVQLLKQSDRTDPLQFLQKTLTIEAIISMRQGMMEWFEAALSENDSIVELPSEQSFELYEKLQMVVEALYLIIITPSEI